jgi:hypothetical protein
VHCSNEIDAGEQALERAMVGVVGGARSLVSIANVRLRLRDLYGIPSTNVTVHRFHPEYFFIIF